MICVPSGNHNKYNVYLTLVTDNLTDDYKLFTRKTYQPLKDSLEKFGIKIVKPNYLARLFYDSVVSTGHKDTYLKRKYVKYVRSRSCSAFEIDGNITYENDTDKLGYRFYFNFFERNDTTNDFEHTLSFALTSSPDFWDVVIQIIKVYVLVTSALNSNTCSITLKEINVELSLLEKKISTVLPNNATHDIDDMLYAISKKLVDYAQSINPSKNNIKSELTKIRQWILRRNFKLSYDAFCFCYEFLYDAKSETDLKLYADHFINREFSIKDNELFEIERAYICLIKGDWRSTKNILTKISANNVQFTILQSFVNRIELLHPPNYTRLFSELVCFYCYDDYKSKRRAKQFLKEISQKDYGDFSKIAKEILKEI